MFSYPRLGTETRPSVDSRVALPTNPAPSYDSGVGYTNGTLHFGDRDGTAKKDERGSTLHFGDPDGLIRKRKGTHLRTSSDQREEKERVDQTSDPPGPDNQPKRPCGTPWRTRPLMTVISGARKTTTAASAPPSG